MSGSDGELPGLEEAYGLLAEAASSWGVPLSAEQLARIRSYIQELMDYNAKTNLTAETRPAALLLRHVADGLAATGALKARLAVLSPQVLDLGAGGGFIGMAVKIAWPEARVTLMESTQRKYRFLNGMAARTGLAGLSVSWRRAGQGLRPGSQGATRRDRDYDAVAARALAPLPEALGLALPLTGPGGLFMAFQTAPPDPQEPLLAKALAKQAARLVECIPYRLPLEDRDRCLAVFRRMESSHADA